MWHLRADLFKHVMLKSAQEVRKTWYQIIVKTNEKKPKDEKQNREHTNDEVLHQVESENIDEEENAEYAAKHHFNIRKCSHRMGFVRIMSQVISLKVRSHSIWQDTWTTEWNDFYLQ